MISILRGRVLISAFLLCSCLVLSLLTGCREKRNLVAVVPRTTGTPLWEALHAGVADEAAGKDIQIYWNAPPDDADTSDQLDMIGAYKKNRYKGIIFAPIDTMASRSIVLETIEDHIPVVLIDDVKGEEPNRYLSYVDNDERIGGKLAAMRTAKLLRNRGTIAIIGISARVVSTSTREEAFEQALAEIAPQITVTVRRFGDANVIRQQQVAQEIISSPDHHVDAIIALSASSTRGAFYAKITAKPRSRILLIGFDQDLLAPLETGDIDSIIAQDTREIGRRAMSNLISQMHGKPTSGVTLVPPLLITKDNVHSSSISRLWDYQHYDWSRQ